jgi:hypothetical protein
MDDANPGVVANACNPSIWEAEAEGLQVQGQPVLHSKLRDQLGLHSELLSPKGKKIRLFQN